MIEFRDDEGRPWRLALTIAAAMRVRDTVRIDVDIVDTNGEPTGKRESIPFDLADVKGIGKTFEVLRGQFVTVGEVLYAILCAQVSEKGLTKEQFLDGLRGDSLDAARTALESELADFFPNRLRRMVRMIGAKMDEVSAEMMDRAEAQMQAASVAELSGMPSGKRPESSAFTPESGHSANLPPPVMPD